MPRGPFPPPQPFAPSSPPAQQQPTVTSPIQPSPVYSPTQTQGAVNQAMAAGHQAAYSQPTYTLPGISQLSPGLLSRSLLDSAGSLADASSVAERLRMGDRMANAQQLLAQQLARITGTMGGARSLGDFRGIEQGFAGRAGSTLLSALLARIGGLGGAMGEGLGDRDFWANLGLRGQMAAARNMVQRGQLATQMLGLGGY
jgi:hypothetical protein